VMVVSKRSGRWREVCVSRTSERGRARLGSVRLLGCSAELGKVRNVSGPPRTVLVVDSTRE
jgi:hypothetical protein